MTAQTPPRSAISRNRRAHQRHVLVGHDVILRRGSASHPCTVRNISSAGLMAVTYEADLSTGPAQIEFATGERFAGSLLWMRDWQLGFAFDEQIDVERLLASLDAGSAQRDRRADRRILVDCAAKLRVNGRFYFGRIADISCAGARFQTPGRLKKMGASVLIAPDLPPLPSMIRWAREGEFGLEFDERVPTAALDRWLAERDTH